MLRLPGRQEQTFEAEKHILDFMTIKVPLKAGSAAPVIGPSSS